MPSVSTRHEIIEERHVLLGHCLLAPLLRSLREGYYWVGMVDDIAEVLAQCDACQKSRARLGTAKELSPTDKGTGPFQVWSIDSIPNLGGSEGLVVVCVDCFSKWVEVGHVPTREAGAVWRWFY